MLRFDAHTSRYRCKLMAEAQRPRALARVILAWLVAHWIAAGRGCDSASEARRATEAWQVGD
jgi:hypothetical protein